MEFISYNAELGVANELFKRLFSDIRIERTNSKGQKSLLQVPCVFGQRSRIVKALENPDGRAKYKVPMIVINRTGYSRQPDRLNNLHNEVRYEISEKRRNYFLLTPVPIDVSYDVSVVAKYPGDVDKIASNFMVFFNSDVYCSQVHPKFSDVKLNNQVIMSDSVSEEHSDELDGTRDDLIVSTFNFTFKTYLFGGTDQYHRRRARRKVEQLSTFVSSYVYEFRDDDEVRRYLQQETHAKLSTTLTCEVTAPVTSYVEEVSGGGEYDDGIPKVYGLDFGFYAVPKKEDILGYMTSVDNGLIAKHEHWAPSSYISSEAYYGPTYEEAEGPDGGYWRVRPAPLSTEGDYYEPVDNYCTLAPYVDRVVWRIDGASEYQYPDNVRAYNGCGDVPVNG